MRRPETMSGNNKIKFNLIIVLFHYGKGLADYLDGTSEKSNKKTTHSMSPFVHAKESQMFKLLQHASIAYSVLSVDAMSYFFYTKSPIP